MNGHAEHLGFDGRMVLALPLLFSVVLIAANVALSELIGERIDKALGEKLAIIRELARNGEAGENVPHDQEVADPPQNQSGRETRGATKKRPAVVANVGGQHHLQSPGTDVVASLKAGPEHFKNIAAWSIDAGSALVGTAGVVTSGFLVLQANITKPGPEIGFLVLVILLIYTAFRVFSTEPSTYKWKPLSRLQGVLVLGNGLVAGLVLLFG